MFLSFRKEKQKKYYERLLKEKDQSLTKTIDFYENQANDLASEIERLEKFIKAEYPKLPISFKKGLVTIDCDNFSCKYNGNIHETEIYINKNLFPYVKSLDFKIDVDDQRPIPIILSILGIEKIEKDINNP